MQQQDQQIPRPCPCERTSGGLRFFAMARDANPAMNLVLDERKNVVITAPTGEYRHWLEAHQADAGLWAEPVVLKRKAP